MATQNSKKKMYKGYEIIATSMPIVDGTGFNAGLYICKEHGDYRTEEPINLESRLFNTQEEAFDYATNTAQATIDART